MTADESRCMRCRRPNPAAALLPGDLPSDWEVVENERGEVAGVICPGCITGEEQQAIDEDVMEFAESLKQCARCAKPAPEFPSGLPQEQGWYVLGHGLVCTDCMRPDDWRAAVADSLRTLGWKRRLRREED